MNEVIIRGSAANNTPGDDLATYARFRARQRQQRREAGSMRRSNALLDLVQGKLERGTRAKNRGPYPKHLIDNCARMAARNRKRVAGSVHSYSDLEVTVNGQAFPVSDSINCGAES